MASITVNYNLKDAGYANYANQKLRFTLLGAGAKASTDYVVAKGFVTSTSDANGDGSVTLYRSAESGIANNIYEILLPGNERVQVITPDTATIELAELLVNHRVSTSTPEVSGINTASITATTCDLNGGTIDGTSVGATSASTGAFTTLSATSNVDFNAGAIDGVTIGANSAAAGTFTAITGTSLNVGDGNITNAGDINCDSVSVDDASSGLDINFGGNTGLNKISLTDNLASALDVTEGSNSYLKFTTTDSSEQIVVGKNSTFASTTIADLGTVTTADINGGTMDGVTIGGTTAADITGEDVLANRTLGFTTGNGVAVTQTTSITTSVTANGTSGVITCISNSFSHATNTTFTVFNSFVDSTDVVAVSQQAGDDELGVEVTDVGSGSFKITIRSHASSGSMTKVVKINFAVIKTVTS